MTTTDRAFRGTEKIEAFSAAHIARTITTALGAVLGLATLMGFCLHLAGDVAHSTYLDGMGIPASLFPQAVDAKIILGYYVMVFQGVAVLNDVPWRTVLFLFFFSTATIVILRAPATGNPRLAAWLRRLPYLIKESISVGAVVALSASVLASICCFLLLLAIVPGFAAERYGKNKADERLKLLTSADRVRVSELWKDGKQLARGQVIAATSDVIAFYDLEQRAMRTVPAAGIEIRTPAPVSDADKLPLSQLKLPHSAPETRPSFRESSDKPPLIWRNYALLAPNSSGARWSQDLQVAALLWASFQMQPYRPQS